jgi:hypothetical protein
MIDPETRAAIDRVKATLITLSAEVGELHAGVMSMLVLQTQTMQTLAKVVPAEQFPPELRRFYERSRVIDREEAEAESKAAKG